MEAKKLSHGGTFARNSSAVAGVVALLLGLSILVLPLSPLYPACNSQQIYVPAVTTPAAAGAAAPAAAPATAWLGAPSRAIPPNVTVMVFGGSTTFGRGVSDPDKKWVEEFKRAFERLTGSNVTLVNRGRGGTMADYFASCFSRYLNGQPTPTVFLLEFAINGGNVTRLVESMLRSSDAPVVLVRQMACYPAIRYSSATDLDARVSWPEQREEQRTAAYVYRLHEFDFVSHVVPEYGSPCSADSLPKLFEVHEAPGQHLGDLGQHLLGEFVASELVRNWDAVFDPTRRAATPQPPAFKETCFYADESGNSCAGEGAACSIENAFAPDGEGWAFVAKAAGRKDKICWQADKSGVRLTTVDPVEFFEATIYADFTDQNPSTMELFCGDQLLKEIQLKHGMRGSMVKAVTLPAACSGQKLTIVAKEAAPDKLLRVCGISMFS
ncbi:hypothetical protein Rsub_02353 [Raphidocelis subcapitata]|uniref:SGNH hydrolase-type esterase domain-containing protein n=1 Tax=Raphidocelis subcapitata TaxID=307507 RepID=A0A2V0NXT0_9CHLO|nr:hypothetical protein Rsub_02353 [Raphidocelis subcapitata]|eukprot:GBF89635.1 hypothetical protein Rsub_02353 [Raphidocelis subcapitata]